MIPLALVAALLAAVAVGARTGGQQQHVASSTCDNGRLRLKAWADPERYEVSVNHVLVTNIDGLRQLPPPGFVPRRRVTRFQRHIWRVAGQIVEYRLDEGELRMVLYADVGKFMNVVVPSPSCLFPISRQHARLVHVWQRLLDCGLRPTRSYQSLGAVAWVTGVGYWANTSLNTARRGPAPNGAELHPVTQLGFLSGCGA